MIARGAAAGAALLLCGCVYYNAVYNAENVFERSEAYRAAGQDSLALLGYGEVVDKAAHAFRMEPEGPWASDAIFLLGRAQLRRGDLRAARAALDDALSLAATRGDSLSVFVYLAAVDVQLGEYAASLPALNDALRELPQGPELAEGHYWRGRLLLATGHEDGGWWDLDHSARIDPTRALDAALHRVATGILLDRPERAREGARLLYGLSGGGAATDSLLSLLSLAESRWGPEGAVGLIGGVETAAWRPAERGRLRLGLARALYSAGDTSRAYAAATTAAEGAGAVAAQARFHLASWRLAGIGDLASARAVVPTLLPAVGQAPADTLLSDLNGVTALADLGLDDPLAWFAAGELARDRLGAPILARGLFLAYADAAPEGPWAAKALLAAISVTEVAGDRAWLRGRLERYGGSPYVLAARGDPAPGFEQLEEELAERLARMRSR